MSIQGDRAWPKAALAASQPEEPEMSPVGGHGGWAEGGHLFRVQAPAVLLCLWQSLESTGPQFPHFTEEE